MNAHAKAQLKINKPVEDVFNAIIDPTKLCQYFTSTASAPMVEGTTVTWTWTDVDAAFFIDVQTIKPNKNIAFQWTATDSKTLVNITITYLDANSTLVNVLETGWEISHQGLEYINRQTGGWMHMLSCLKAFLEFGINLRVGAACY